MNSGKRKRIFVLLIGVLLAFFVMSVLAKIEEIEQGVSYEEFSNEEKEGHYEINSIEDYLQFAETVAFGNTYQWCEIHLNTDLDFSGIQNVPVIGLKNEQTVAFQGIFNGNGYVIRNLCISNPSGPAGMFANLEGVVKNLSMENCEFLGKNAVQLRQNLI